MLDTSASVKLAKGLTSFTRKGELRWQEKPDNDLASALRSWRGTGRPKTYSAVGGGAVYEISSTDGFGGAPYGLRVWEFDGTKQVPVAEIASSINISDPAHYQLNEALKELFTLVDEMTETSDQIVDRLLGNLGDPN